MRVVALISGGKDSCYNMMQCVAAGHEIVALANLQPIDTDELDSYMYQTVGHDGIFLYAEAMGLPLYRKHIVGNALTQEKQYSITEGDEVEDLFQLLSQIKEKLEYDAVSVGAILSDYQRIRVENVCSRLGLVSLAYLWRRNQSELLQEMIDCGIEAIIIKTASLGLEPDKHLGLTIEEIQPHLLSSKEKYSINVCGEGGEYETFTLDCPLFIKSIYVENSEIVIHSNDAIAPVGYLKLNKLLLVNKEKIEEKENVISKDESSVVLSNGKLQKEQLEGIPIKTPQDYLSDLAYCKKTNCCDGRDEICLDQKVIEESSNLSVGASTFSSNSSISGIGGSSGGNNDDIETDMIDDFSSSTELLNQHISLSTLLRTRESHEFPTGVTITTNERGWSWIMGIGVTAPENTDVLNYNPMRTALTTLKHTLSEHGMTLGDVVSISMFVSSMDDYSSYNSEYTQFFTVQPPVRLCVQAPLPLSCPLLLDALALPGHVESSSERRSSMHVQSISHWAPANIGPYSQASWARDIIYVAGQIGLVPGSMKLIEGGPRLECKLALRHINRVLRSTDLKVEIRDVVQAICFVTNPKFIVKCREEWEKRSNNAIVEYLVVPRLPRDANVEWSVWAHTHNSAFEYEETGCYIGSGVKVKIFRRWNYENRVSVIICRASICDQTGRIGTSELGEIADYALNKLLQEAVEADKSLECAIRIYYKVGHLNPSDIFKVFGTRSSVACSIVPVCSLVQDNTVLSICGTRHQ